MEHKEALVLIFKFSLYLLQVELQKRLIAWYKRNIDKIDWIKRLIASLERNIDRNVSLILRTGLQVIAFYHL